MPLLGTGSSHNTGRFKRDSSKGRKPFDNQTVVCQKCLQKGHWTYQCKNDAVYTSRPTRTKQLLRPNKRKAYLDSSEVPDEFKSGHGGTRGEDDVKKGKVASRSRSRSRSRSTSTSRSYYSSSSYSSSDRDPKGSLSSASYDSYSSYSSYSTSYSSHSASSDDD